MKNTQSLEQVHASTRRPGPKESTLEKMVKEAEAASKGLDLNQSSAAGEESAPAEPNDESEDESGDEDDSYVKKITDCIPCSHEAVLKGHTRAVSALSLDPAGARLISGSYDCSVRLWDFNGMDASLKSFREFTPWEGQQVKSLHYSITGDKFICATMKNQATIYTRDAVKEVEFAKGDMYVHDMGQTKGHVAALACARWHPQDRALCLTAAIDGTVRLWDVTMCDKKQVTVLKAKNTRGQKAIPHAAAYRPNGDVIAACDDGTIKLWDSKAVARGSTQRAHAEAVGAHTPGAEATCVAVAGDGFTLLSRSRDDTLKVWDLRKLKSALAAFGGLDNFFDTTAAVFGPGDEYFMTGTSVRRAKDGSAQGAGRLHVYRRATLEAAGELDFPSGSAVSALWHPRLNQVFVGGSDAGVHGLYDPRVSENGVVRSLGRQAKRADFTNAGISQVGLIYAPHALPMFREDKARTTAKQKRKDRADPVKSSRPDLGPVAAMQKGLAYPGMQTSRSFAQHLFKEAVGPAGQDYLNQDPREELLKYAEDAAKNPTFTAIYRETQPETVFDLSEERTEKRAKPYSW